MWDEFVRPGDFTHLSVVTEVFHLVSVSVCGLHVLSNAKSLLVDCQPRLTEFLSQNKLPGTPSEQFTSSTEVLLAVWVMKL